VSQIKAIALDVDGVLTDGTFWWGPDGQEWKRFSFRDVMGISRAHRAGLVFALISGEDSPLVDRFARKLGIDHVFKGCKDKAAALKSFAAQGGFSLSEIAFMGDDINDLEAMKLAGLSAAPADAHDSAREQASFVSRRAAGRGALRDFLDYLSTSANASSSTKPCAS
jgi:3-deoxy-D-manno-octulosonate 8-phosphate phosphatase (KDO 8-P phosphatase)